MICIEDLFLTVGYVLNEQPWRLPASWINPKERSLREIQLPEPRDMIRIRV